MFVRSLLSVCLLSCLFLTQASRATENSAPNHSAASTGRASAGPASGSHAQATEEEVFKRLSGEIERLSQEISDQMQNYPRVRLPFQQDIRQISPSYRKQFIEGLKSHLKALEVLKKLIAEGKLAPGVVKMIEIAGFAPGVGRPMELSSMRELRIPTRATEAQIRAAFAALPTKEQVEKTETEIQSLARTLSNNDLGIRIDTIGGAIKTLNETLAGLKSIQAIFPHLDLAPKAITSLGIGSQLGYSDFTKMLTIPPGATVQQVNDFLKTVPFSPTAATYQEVDRLIASTHDPLIQQTLRKGVDEMKKLDVSKARGEFKLTTRAAARLGVEHIYLQGPSALQNEALLTRLVQIDTSRMRPDRAVRTIRISGTRNFPIDYKGTIEVPANATDDAIIQAINATPDKQTFEAQRQNVEHHLEQAGRKMGPGDFVTLDFNRVTQDEALRAANFIEELADKGYRLVEPAKGFWVVSASTPGWAGARYWDDRKQLIMLGAQATEEELVHGGFIVKR